MYATGSKIPSVQYCAGLSTLPIIEVRAAQHDAFACGVNERYDVLYSVAETIHTRHAIIGVQTFIKHQFTSYGSANDALMTRELAAIRKLLLSIHPTAYVGQPPCGTVVNVTVNVF
jgi:hypothetical protein